MDNKSAEEIRLKNMRYDMVMEDDLMQRHAYHNNSNTIPLNSRQVKTRQDKARHDEIYIDSLHIMTMTITMTTKIKMTSIIQ